jgi:hypothetical protein
MLDASNPLPVPDADVLVWADTDGPDVVWALPASPRPAMAADGQPDFSLMLYRRGAGSPPDGGQLTLTVDLALTARERAVVADAADALRPRPADRDAPPLPPVEVRTPSWNEATVHAELVPGLTADGRPSLMGDNSCLMALQLDAAAAADVQRAWEAGFPDASVELRGTVDGTYSEAATLTATSTVTGTATGTATSSASAEDCDSGPVQQRQLRVNVAAAARGAVAVELHLHGPLRLPAEARTTRRTDLTL